MSERAFASGGNKYYIVERNGRMSVWKTAWMPGRDKVGDVHDLDEAFALIRADSGSQRIEAR